MRAALTPEDRPMPFMFVVGSCVACHAMITFNPHHVPSLRVRGEREPLCKSCFARWNKIHRTSQGLEPLPLHPEAYESEEVF
jgi:hypothetical protein